MTKPISILLYIFLFAGCKNKDHVDKIAQNADKTDSGKTKFIKSARSLTIDTILLNKYKAAFENDTVSSEKMFLSKLLKIINDFNGRKLDTTARSIGDIDGDGVKDTIFSRVYYNSDSIFVESKWIKNNKIFWDHTYTNPYLSFNSDLFDYPTRSIWAIFAIGIVYGTPEFQYREPGEPFDPLVYSQGMSDLKEAGILISEEDYKKYIQNFKGELLLFGEPETRERLWIWYKPGRRLITYYQP